MLEELLAERSMRRTVSTVLPASARALPARPILPLARLAPRRAVSTGRRRGAAFMAEDRRVLTELIRAKGIKAE
jgi:hypothetical protein